MKKIVRFWVAAMFAVIVQGAFAQKADMERMERDIEVAENVLSTLIRQEVSPRGRFFGLEVKGIYQEGYGVTFRLPGDYSSPGFIRAGEGTMIYRDNDLAPTVAYSISSTNDDHERTKEEKEAYDLREKVREKKRMSLDSAREAYNNKLIKAAKDFLIDYSDFLTQLSPTERIVVTNKNENRSWFYKEAKRKHISIEATKADITAFKQGKITRDQALAKLKVVNTEVVDTKEQDLELLVSIFGRLYRTDLAKTYFSSENNIYYERLKDYGVVYYMETFSSNEPMPGKLTLPTQGMTDVDKATRDKKVTELYPKFEQELKENILEYGRTVRSLGDDEILLFNVSLTKCKGCGIPSTVEVSIKNSVLKDFAAGKIDKNAAMSKFTVKKGVAQ
ncbi:MAG TPA: hypothetical protein VGD31_04805 [Sphingobacteriaceae bacterium]